LGLKDIRSIVEEHMKLDIGPTWGALIELRQERNLIAHGTWSVRFGGDSPGETGPDPEGLFHVGGFTCKPGVARGYGPTFALSPSA
jgi:hypothetical protein